MHVHGSSASNRGLFGFLSDKTMNRFFMEEIHHVHVCPIIMVWSSALCESVFVDSGSEWLRSGTTTAIVYMHTLFLGDGVSHVP